jgi:uncharacterized SAM-binding protein YcdF (DUF218 family)
MLRAFRISRRALVRVLLTSAAIWLLIICGLVTAVHVYGQADRSQDADVIIVLGAGLRRNNEPAPALLRRSLHGAALYHAGKAPVIICAGGISPSRTRSEADVCREILEAEGVPRAAIWLETRSRSTEENALFTQAIMQTHGWQTAVVVSDNYHLLRAQWLFSSLGVQTHTSPTTTPQRVSSYWSSVAREVAALHWQAFKEVLNLPFTYVPVL